MDTDPYWNIDEDALNLRLSEWLDQSGIEKIVASQVQIELEAAMADYKGEFQHWLQLTDDKQDIQVELWTEVGENRKGRVLTKALLFEMLDDFEGMILVDEYPACYRHLAECFENRAANYRKQLAAMKPE